VTALVTSPEVLTPAPIPRADRLRAAGWMLAAQLGFAAMTVLARQGAPGAAWQELAVFRFFGGLVVAALIAAARGVSLRPRDKKLLAARAGFGTLSAVGTFYTIDSQAISLGDASTLFATSPFFVALLAPFVLKERFRPQVGGALAIAFLGVAIVAKPTFDSAPDLVAAATGSAFSAACAMMALRLASHGEPPESIAFFFHLVGLVVLSALAIPGWSSPSVPTMLTLTLAGVCGGVAQLMMTKAYTLDLAARVSVLGYAGLVFTRLAGAIVFGEPFGLREIAGTCAILGAGALLTRGR
jgi:drug/metabolite transporter (DMT)-like permease